MSFTDKIIKSAGDFNTVNGRANGKKIKRIILGIALLLLVLFLNPFVIVSAGHRGVVLNFGAVGKDVLGEGIHFRIPIVQKIILLDVRVQKTQTGAEAVSKDLQDTNTTIAVNFHILPDKANVIYQTIGTAFKERVLDPAVQEVVKAITAKYTAQELISQREKVRSEIKDLLKERMLAYNIVIDDFAIVNFKFSQQFEQAIEAKQAADQLAQKAQRDLERIKIEAQQKITQAKAEAEALALQKQNVTSELIKLREIEARIKAIEKWDGHLPKLTGGAVPFIGIEEEATKGKK
ncbi:MAG: prohibitin family protein [Nitrospirae bacterium]|nr:prohibitin family protein [Nitrospirota bacterium]